MATMVSIQIRVEDGNTSSVIDAMTAKMTQLGVQGEASMKKLSAAADSATNAVSRTVSSGSPAVKWMQEMGNAGARAASVGAPGVKWMQQMGDTGGRVASVGAPAVRWMQQLGDAGARVATVGVPALRWMQQVEKAATPAVEKTGHLTTSLDNIRLASQSLGIRLPRALESAFSRVPAIATALGAVGGGLVAIGSLEVLVHLGEQAYGFYKQLFDVNAQLREFEETIGKSKNAELFDTASLETAKDLLDQTNDQLDDLRAKKEAAGVGPNNKGNLLQYPRYGVKGLEYLVAGGTNKLIDMGTPDSLKRAGVNLQIGSNAVRPEVYTPKDAARAAKIALENEQSRARRNELQRQADLEDVRLQGVDKAVGLRAYAEAAQARDNAIAEAKQIQKNTLDRETDLVNVTKAARAEQLANKMDVNDPNLTPVHRNDPKAGQKEFDLAREKADNEYHSKTIALTRAERDETITAHNEAVKAGIDGDRAYLVAKQQMDDTINRRRSEGLIQPATQAALLAANQTKYDNERMARLRALTEQTDKLAEAAKQAGLPEAGRIAAEHDEAIADINKVQAKSVIGDSDDPAKLADFARQRSAADDVYNQKNKEFERQFTEYVKGQIDQRTDAQLQGFAKIDAETQRSISASNRNFADKFGDKGQFATPQELSDHAADLANIKAQGEAQKAPLRQRNADEDLQYEREAAQSVQRIREQGILGWVAAYKNGIAEIQAQDDARTAKLTADFNNKLIQWDDFDRRKNAIDASANAQIAEQNANLQHTIAGQLQSAFTDPTAFIKQKMEQMFFEIIAAWIMRTQLFKQFFGNTLGSMQPGASSAPAGFGGILGSVLGGHAAGMPSAAGGAPLGTAGVIPSGTSLPPSWTASPGVSSNVGAGGIVRPAGVGNSTYSPASTGSTIQGVTGLARQVSQIAGGNKSAAGSDADSNLDAWLNGSNSPGAMQSVGGAPGLSGAMNGVAGFGALAYGAYSGTQGVLDAFHKGGLNGALGGAMSGAEAGAAIGSIVPGLGTAVGAVVGAAIGLGTNLVGDILGESGRFAARDYYKQTLFPQMEQIETSYNSGTGADFLNGISQANAAASQGYAYMRAKWGASAADWVKSNYLDKETSKVVQDITALAGGGHQYTARSAAQFHAGGVIAGFGDLATSSTEGFIHAQLGERLIKPVPGQAHAPFLSAINSGADAAQMAAMYLQAAGGGGSIMPSSSGSGDVHLHVHTMDTKTMKGWLRDEGASMIGQALNERNGLYGGDANV